MKSIILTGGGTAGHVMPNVALLPSLQKNFEKIVYVGNGGIDQIIIEKENIPYYKISAVPYKRGKILQNFSIPFLLEKGIKESEKIIDKIKPNVIFAKGGFVSLPICLAGRKKSIPVIIHESDYTLGLANRIVTKFASRTLTSFPETKGGIYVGNPVRDEILHGSKFRAIQKLHNYDASRKTVLICGGSQGSSIINETTYRALPEIAEMYNVIHVAGKSADFSREGNHYTLLGYTEDFPDFLALSDVLVCRAGANTLFESASNGKPTLCIPLPKGNSRGDQILNAKSFEKQGYVKILWQENLFVETLMEGISDLFDFRPPKINVKDTNKKIIDNILSTIETM